MVKPYDVVVVGAGPGGLRTAELLARGGCRVMVLEKRPAIGHKVCAGGLTYKCRSMGIPDRLLERQYDRIRLKTIKRAEEHQLETRLLSTVDRSALGNHQAEMAATAGAEIVTGVRVSTVNRDHVVLAGGRRVAFDYLVGADGAHSVVRRDLGLPRSRHLNCLQYEIPREWELPELHFDVAHFGPWCCWVFPHRGWTAVGAGADPVVLPAGELKQRLNGWLGRMGISPNKARLSGAAIPIDYCGTMHGERYFLVGDAAGLAFEFSGEGIYSAMVCAEEVARSVLEAGYVPDVTRLLRKKKMHRRLIRILNFSPALCSVLHGWLVRAPRNRLWRRFLLETVL